jgi:ribosomal protein L14
MGPEIGQHIGVCAQFESVDRGIAGDAPGALVVVNDQEVAGKIEKVVQRTDDHDVDVQEEGGSLQAVKVGLRKRGQLGPAALRDAGRQVQRRNGQALHFRANALCVVGQADQMEVAGQVPAHHRVRQS